MTGPEWVEEGKKRGEGSPEPDAFARDVSPLGDAELPVANLSAAEEAWLDSELRTALRPPDLPAGFADRVVAKAFPSVTGTNAGKRAKVLPFRSWRLVAGGTIAACLVAGFFGAADIHQHREREHAAAMANQQFETATRITDEALEHTREQLRRAGVDSLQ